jgi:hypothetical protein
MSVDEAARTEDFGPHTLWRVRECIAEDRGEETPTPVDERRGVGGSRKWDARKSVIKIRHRRSPFGKAGKSPTEHARWFDEDDGDLRARGVEIMGLSRRDQCSMRGGGHVLETETEGFIGTPDELDRVVAVELST